MSNIHSIYPATEGEGVRIGTPQVFVRFQGCAVGCVNCDSRETWNFKKHNEYTIGKLVNTILSYDLKWTSITGGDPLDKHHRDDVLQLIKELKSHGQKINIEVTGLSIDLEIFELADFISFDIKTPSTGVSADKALLIRFIENYGDKSQIKAVIQTKADFEYAYDFYLHCKEVAASTNWVMTPACSSISPLSMKNFEWILEENQRKGACFRVIGQQHKWVFGQDRLDI